MTDCFKTRARNAVAAVPAPEDTGTAGYFRNFTDCNSDDGTPISADWVNNLIVNLEAIVNAAIAINPAFDQTSCDDILKRALDVVDGSSLEEAADGLHVPANDLVRSTTGDVMVNCTGNSVTLSATTLTTEELIAAGWCQFSAVVREATAADVDSFGSPIFVGDKVLHLASGETFVLKAALQYFKTSADDPAVIAAAPVGSHLWDDAAGGTCLHYVLTPNGAGQNMWLPTAGQVPRYPPPQVTNGTVTPGGPAPDGASVAVDQATGLPYFATPAGLWAPTVSHGVESDATLAGTGAPGDPISVVFPDFTVASDATLTGDGSDGSPLSVVFPDFTVASDATLNGDGSDGSPLSVVFPDFTVASDASISGDGSDGSPLSVNFPVSTVSSDATITGDGSPGSPLSVVFPTLPDATVSSDATLTGTGAPGSPLSVVFPDFTVASDATITGDGSDGSPLSVVFPDFTVASDASISGDGSDGSPLSVNFPTPTVSSDATITGDGSPGSPLSVVFPTAGPATVSSDATLTGDGAPGSPLSVVFPDFTVASDTSITGDGSDGSPLSVNFPTPTVSSDATISGDGSPGDPLKVAARYYTTSGDSAADIDSAPVGSHLHDDAAAGTGYQYIRHPNGTGADMWIAIGGLEF